MTANETKLRDACNWGYFEDVKHLDSIGQDLHYKNDEALNCAVRAGHIDIVEY